MGKFIDMTGWKMSEHGVPDSRITVINRAENQGKQIAWNCQCECGKQVVIRGDQLRSGITKSCGCLQKEIAKDQCSKTGKNNKGKIGPRYRDIAGQEFGRLKAIEPSYHKNKKIYWKCICQCGNITYVETSKLISGHTRSCGCVKSYGETLIASILQEYNICYAREYTFSDLKDRNNLRFDFAIFKNNKLYCLIEYQGQQHYDDNLSSWASPKEHDKMKKKYCENNNIKLIEIPYTDYEKINYKYIKEKCDL